MQAKQYLAPWNWKEFEPKLVGLFRSGYSLDLLKHDLFAGMTIAIVGLPLAMALSVACGTTPDKGLYTAIIGGFFISFFGGSRTQVGGPTAAFVVIIANIIFLYGFSGLLLATLMAGIMLVIAGLARLGAIIKYVPYSVITGFTTALALGVFIGQLKDLFGLAIESLPSDFVHRLFTYATTLTTFDTVTTLLGVSNVIAILVIRRFVSKIPVLLVVIAISAFLVNVFDLPISTIQSHFGDIPHGLPTPSLPDFSYDYCIKLFPSACTIAFLAGIESLLCAVIADGMTGDQHRPNIELIAQGLANIVCAFFSGIPATAAFARTATNVKAGAKTPLAGIISSVLIFIAVLGLGDLAGMIPLASLAAILVVVALDMSGVKRFIRFLAAPLGDRLVMISTFVLTLLFDLGFAIQIGIILSALVFMRRMGDLTQLTPTNSQNAAEGSFDKNIPEDVTIYHINGPFFFGAASRMQAAFNKHINNSKTYILNMKNMPMIDATGAQILAHFIEKCQKQGCKVILTDVKSQPKEVLKKLGIYRLVSQETHSMKLEQAIELCRHHP